MVAVPSRTAALLREWLDAIDDDPEVWVFPSENRTTPMWRDNVWYRGMKPRLKAVGLESANFQVMRRRHATLGHELGIDPKIAADQRGQGIRVALSVYTKASLNQKLTAAEILKNAVFKGYSDENGSRVDEMEGIVEVSFWLK